MAHSPTQAPPQIRKAVVEVGTLLHTLLRTLRLAACTQLRTQLFFAEGSGLATLAALTCQSCVVQDLCMWGEIALEDAQGSPRTGLWGALPEERLRLSSTTTVQEFIEIVARTAAEPVQVDANDIGLVYRRDFDGTLVLRDEEAEGVRRQLIVHLDKLRTLVEQYPETGEIMLDDLRPYRSENIMFVSSRRGSRA